MTTPQLTQEEKRIKIAEACRMVPPFTSREEDWSDEGGGGTATVTRDSHYNPIPDYFNDLNACHEMEKMMRLRDRAEYWHYCKKLDGLCSIYNFEDGRMPQECIATLEAPAAMRCEAFGKALNLWP